MVNRKRMLTRVFPKNVIGVRTTHSRLVYKWSHQEDQVSAVFSGMAPKLNHVCRLLLFSVSKSRANFQQQVGSKTSDYGIVTYRRAHDTGQIYLLRILRGALECLYLL